MAGLIWDVPYISKNYNPDAIPEFRYPESKNHCRCHPMCLRNLLLKLRFQFTSQNNTNLLGIIREDS